MCLILVSINSHASHPLIIASNRDEFHNRETAAMKWHGKNPAILSGIDLKEGGTWLGLTKTGRFAALTNFRDPTRMLSDAPSRGWIVSRFLKGNDSPEAFVKTLRKESAHQPYNGFNLLFGELTTLFHYSNISDALTPLSDGVHGICNALLDTPWPKVETGRKALSALSNPSHDDLFSLLSDTSKPKDQLLPDTGMGLEWERILSSIFIESPIYGTRSSCVITLDHHRQVAITQKTHQGPNQTTEERTFRVVLG
ncbi:MAG: NRDE family protein [Desulfobacterales bacterium]|nr:NRDE family protein [Desulfobacterales bacterium]